MTEKHWRFVHNRCWVCGWVGCIYAPSKGRFRLETHHIASGVHRKGGSAVIANLIRVCNVCHYDLHDRFEWPIEKVLALKLLQDKEEHYDRVAVNLLRGRQPDAITEDEVQVWVNRMCNT